MNLSLEFVITSVMLGVGLAMDAFSVSLANGLNEPCMKRKKIFGIAGTFAIFQMLMPLIGWGCVHTIAEYFKVFQKFIPWIALALLGFIGINMIREAGEECECGECIKLTFTTLMIQGVATSIDALSVGFTISDYGFVMALVCSCIIALVTFVICVSGVIIGKKFGTKLAGKASILGGVILIIIGLKIFVDGVF
ncbi:MAG: manganese efflux pump [Lachnospiraceae bacterium]|nr:manganese efflux pump [Lachnospiraceae bacterium]